MQQSRLARTWLPLAATQQPLAGTRAAFGAQVKALAWLPGTKLPYPRLESKVAYSCQVAALLAVARYRAAVPKAQKQAPRRCQVPEPLSSPLCTFRLPVARYRADPEILQGFCLSKSPKAEGSLPAYPPRYLATDPRRFPGLASLARSSWRLPMHGVLMLQPEPASQTRRYLAEGFGPLRRGVAHRLFPGRAGNPLSPSPRCLWQPEGMGRV